LVKLIPFFKEDQPRSTGRGRLHLGADLLFARASAADKPQRREALHSTRNSGSLGRCFVKVRSVTPAARHERAHVGSALPDFVRERSGTSQTHEIRAAVAWRLDVRSCRAMVTD